ncbi:MAG TPA: hypothetical protein VMJ90_07230 [Anaerolineales bacterium]|nr:hypothetical protein [Anaerolineales bacterium]
MKTRQGWSAGARSGRLISHPGAGRVRLLFAASRRLIQPNGGIFVYASDVILYNCAHERIFRP